MSDLLRKRKVFLAAIAASVNENINGVNFTASITTQSYSLLSAKPETLSRALLFIAPYTNEV